MNVYGKKDESYEKSRYPDWTLPEKKETLLPLFSILIGSLIATVISVVLPFIFDLMSPQQTQDLYIGWALHQTGQIYTDYFGTNGLLYYLVAYLLKGSVLIFSCGMVGSVWGRYFPFLKQQTLLPTKVSRPSKLCLYFISSLQDLVLVEVMPFS